MTFPPPFQLVDHLKTKEIVHKVSSVFRLTFWFWYFSCTSKVDMVFRALGILTLPCYFILGDKILDTTGKVMFQRRVNQASHCVLCTRRLLICRICKVFQIALRCGKRWELLLGEFFYLVVGTFRKVKNNNTNQKCFHTNIIKHFY